jgi:uncharacterized protein with HEPN domain
MRDDREWLQDILEAIERIKRYSSRGRQAFLEDELIQSWIVHHLQIIKERSVQYPMISEESTATFPGRMSLI